MIFILIMMTIFTLFQIRFYIQATSDKGRRSALIFGSIYVILGLFAGYKGFYS